MRPTTKSTPQKGSVSSTLGFSLAGRAFKSSLALIMMGRVLKVRSTLRLIEWADESANTVIQSVDHFLLLLLFLKWADEMLDAVLVLLQLYFQLFILSAELFHQQHESNRLQLRFPFSIPQHHHTLATFPFPILSHKNPIPCLDGVHSLFQLLHFLLHIGNRRHDSYCNVSNWF